MTALLAAGNPNTACVASLSKVDEYWGASQCDNEEPGGGCAIGSPCSTARSCSPRSRSAWPCGCSGGGRGARTGRAARAELDRNGFGFGLAGTGTFLWEGTYVPFASHLSETWKPASPIVFGAWLSPVTHEPVQSELFRGG